MMRPDRKRSSPRRRPSPAFESLEIRQLLNGSPVAPHAMAPAHPPIAHLTFHAPTRVVHAASATAHLAAKSNSTHTVAKSVPTGAKPVHAATKMVATEVHNRFFNYVRLPNGPSSGTQATFSPVVGALNPTQLQTAYGVNLLGLANQGQGVTIAIVDEFDDPNILNDVNVYSAQYGLPQLTGDGAGGSPVLSVYKDTALGNVTSAVNTGVGVETSLDVEMAHALAPRANILLVEVPSTGTAANVFAQLLHGGQYAAGQTINGSPVVVVSTSYGLAESSIGNANALSLDATYLSTGASSRVAMTVSTGDGSRPLFPATSPNVIGVGGSSLYLNSARGKYGYETAWGGLGGAGAGGGGPSTNFLAPTFQSANGVTLSTKRTIPDISMVADPVTGVSFYDSLDVNAGAPDPWGSVGGTSVAAPLFAGVLALAQQQRIAASNPILNSFQINTGLYQAYNSPSYSTYFHDVNLGKNSNVTGSGITTVAGYSATTGYDLATGLGTPIASTLVPYLAGL